MTSSKKFACGGELASIESLRKECVERRQPRIEVFERRICARQIQCTGISFHTKQNFVCSDNTSHIIEILSWQNVCTICQFVKSHFSTF